MTLTVHSQSFLTSYPSLTIKNLPDFFADWKIYSDSVAACVPTEGPLYKIMMEQQINKINEEGALIYNPTEDKEITPKYNVVYEQIPVYRYYRDDSHSDISNRESLKEDSTYYVTPPLPENGLYLTQSIKDLLNNFIGGIRKDDTITERSDTNILAILHYIPLAPGHWGGYWWYCSFPHITYIKYANNQIAVNVRCSWHNGYEVEYVKERDDYIFKGYLSSWIE